jgi:iron complex outermembrane receptor protein
MKNQITFFSFFLTICIVGLSFAQSGTVSGTVSDADGPLPGATVVVKGTNTGVTTDFDGNFSIQAAGDDVLVVSYVGFQSQEVGVSNQTNISVVLSSSNELDEVIITGYGSVTKRDATGAIDAISAASFDQVSSDSPAQLLRGKVAGVQITSATGEPGAGVAIRVRGNSSIRSGNEPLIVVDGVPLAGGNTSPGLGDEILGTGSPKNPLNFINQNDIESISVLKDASSTAIYGSRGANGVIVITTKKGVSGASEPQLSYSGSLSSSAFAQNSSFQDVMSKSEFQSNIPSDLPSDSPIPGESGSYNWQDTVLRNAFSQSHDITLTTGGENSSTRLSVGANLQEGIINKTGMDKYNVSLYNSYKLFDGDVNLQTRVLYSDIDDLSHLTTNSAGYIGNLIGAALYWRPSLNTTNTDGSYNVISANYLNPKQLLDSYDDSTNTKRLLANFNVSVNLSDKLTFRTIFGVDRSTSTREAQLLPSIDILDTAQSGDNRGQASVYNDQRFNKTFENTLNYVDSVNGVDIDLLAGFSYYSYLSEGSNLQAKGFNADQVDLINNLGGVVDVNTGYSISSYKNETELQSFFVRAGFTYDKFLATLTYRLDGSSKFGEDNKYGSFPAIGLGYKFIENQAGSINNLKLRGSWGITGNQEFAVNSAISKSRYSNGSVSVVTNANPDLEWETTTSLGVGVDFEILDGKATGSLDYFQRSTENLLFPVPEAATKPGPASPRFVNLDGELVNTGIEVGLNYNLVDSDNMTWDVSANASFLSNEIQNFPGFIPTGELHGQGLSSAYSQVLSNNNPLYSYYMFDFRGYDDNGASTYTQADGSVGPLATASKDVLDKQALPTMNLGLSTSVAMGDWSISTSLYGSFGHYVYNNTNNAYFFKGAYPVRNIPIESAVSAQASSDPNSPSTKYLEKGDFLRLSNLRVGYDLGDSLLDSIGVENTYIYVNGDNLATFTDYTGFDPEVNVDKAMNGVPSTGIDYLPYPRAKTFTLGVNLTF